ncbi:MAG: ATP-binding cassette domain-containing protein [Alphaproteobacteria bacterium]|nr:ATP-binding cassette domain-containing protein [Alphaproteobacteria bacterium]
MAELRFDVALTRPGFRLKMDGALPLEGVTAIMGPSGSGKTTLLSILAGLEPRATGLVLFGDLAWQDARRRLAPHERRVGMVFQEGRLFRHLTVAENLAYGARRRGVEPAAMHGIADALGLRELMHRRPETLSGGEARRVALARAMASQPDILFMDEPLAGLDDTAKAEVLPYIARAVTGSGAPVIYVTHSEAEVNQLADRVLLVEDGEVDGWSRPPPHLQVTVLGAREGMVTLELGGAQFDLPGQGERWDARRIALPEASALLSRDAPGASGALASLPATVTRIAARPSGAEVTVRVEGQLIALGLGPGAPLARDMPREGEQLWLTILSALLR